MITSILPTWLQNVTRKESFWTEEFAILRVASIKICGNSTWLLPLKIETTVSFCRIKIFDLEG